MDKIPQLYVYPTNHLQKTQLTKRKNVLPVPTTRHFFT